MPDVTADEKALRADLVRLAKSYPKGSDERRKLLAVLAPDKMGAEFPAGTIGQEVPGAEGGPDSDAAESWMDGEFTQQEFSELREKQQAGEVPGVDKDAALRAGLVRLAKKFPKGSVERRKLLAVLAPDKMGADFNPDEIGEQEAGPLEDEPDEPFMDGHFTQQENRELGDKEEAGQVAPVDKAAQDFDPKEIGEQESGALEEGTPDQEYQGDNFTEQEHAELREKQEGGDLPSVEKAAYKRPRSLPKGMKRHPAFLRVLDSLEDEETGVQVFHVEYDTSHPDYRGGDYWEAYFIDDDMPLSDDLGEFSNARAALEEALDAFGDEYRFASDEKALRRDLVKLAATFDKGSDERRKLLSLLDPKFAENFPATDIGKIVPGPTDGPGSDAEKPWAPGEFTQQEFSELQTKQEDGELDDGDADESPMKMARAKLSGDERTLFDGLVRLAHSDPEARRPILAMLCQAGLLTAGCEKLPEGPMRDNCEKAKKEGPAKGKGKSKGKSKGKEKMPKELLEKFKAKGDKDKKAAGSMTYRDALRTNKTYEGYLRDYKDAKKKFPHLVMDEKELLSKDEWEKLTGHGSGKAKGKDKKAATRYEVDGEMLTQSQMMAKAQSKEVVFMGNDKKPTFHAVMSSKGGDAKVFKIPESAFMKSRLKDTSSQQQKEKYAAWLLKKKNLSMADAVDYNTWVKDKKPSVDEKIDKLRKYGAERKPDSPLEKCREKFVKEDGEFKEPAFDNCVTYQLECKKITPEDPEKYPTKEDAAKALCAYIGRTHGKLASDGSWKDAAARMYREVREMGFSPKTAADAVVLAIRGRK